MNKRAPIVEWVVTESDADWERLCPPSCVDSSAGVTAATSKRRYAQFVLVVGALMLLLLASAGARWWRPTQAGSHQREGEVRTAVEGQLPAVAQSDGRAATSSAGVQGSIEWRYQFAREYNGLLAATQAADPDEHLDVALHNIEFLGGQDYLAAQYGL